jgi:hypothetical protein
LEADAAVGGGGCWGVAGVGSPGGVGTFGGVESFVGGRFGSGESFVAGARRISERCHQTRHGIGRGSRLGDRLGRIRI